MKVKVRKADAKDYDRVIKLYADLVNQPGRFQKRGNDSYLKALGLDNFYSFVAEKDNRIVGFITFSKRTVVRYPKPIIEVEELYVVPDLRRQGIGRMMVQKAFDEAKKQGYQYVFLASSKERVPAQKFSRALEFDEYAFHFRRKP